MSKGKNNHSYRHNNNLHKKKHADKVKPKKENPIKDDHFKPKEDDDLDWVMIINESKEEERQR